MVKNLIIMNTNLLLLLVNGLVILITGCIIYWKSKKNSCTGLKTRVMRVKNG